MKIEFSFLQKAIQDRNYVSFSYENKKYKNIKAQSLNNETLETNHGSFEFKKITKLKISKQRY